MHARLIRGLRTSAAAAAVVGTLTLAPTATALSTEPAPSASTSLSEAPEPEPGRVALTKTDPNGAPITGASFLLRDAAGQEAGSGKTDAQGGLVFLDIAPGVYRLTETASGSPLYELVADQDVIVTPGATARLTIVDPFKAAQVLVKATDSKSGKLLLGSTVNIGSGNTTVLTLTTGPSGTASGALPVTSATAAVFWVRQIKAPDGYDLSRQTPTFTVRPGGAATVTIVNTKTATTTVPEPSRAPTPTEEPSGPADQPTEETTPSATAVDRRGTAHTSDTDSSPTPAVSPGPGTSPKAAAGTLAHTGADATPWIAGAAGILAALGIVTVVFARRRAAGEPDTEYETSGVSH